MRQEFSEVYSPEELARAAATPRDVIDALIARGELRLIAGTPFIADREARRVGRLLLDGGVPWAAESRARPSPPDLFDTPVDSTGGHRTPPALLSAAAHVMVLIVMMWLTAGTSTTSSYETASEPARLVFVVSPGPGGGGGGGGLRNPLPSPKLQRRGPSRLAIPVPAVTPAPVLTAAHREEPPAPVPAVAPVPIEKAPEPLPATQIVAPVVSAAVSPQDREGVIDRGRGEEQSQGAGQGGGTGSGQGTGNGEGVGAGIGDGSGGGTGGGPYRPGSGIAPPRLLREVKADYTDDARRRNLSGDVVLEIVVRRDGTVGDVKLLQGLGAGLDQRAIAAVRQWRFDPARRKGEAVDVIVEVAVEFTLK